MDGLMYVVALKLARQVQIMGADIVLFKTYLLILAFLFNLHFYSNLIRTTIKSKLSEPYTTQPTPTPNAVHSEMQS